MKNGKSALYEALKRQILTMELDPDEALDEILLSERYGLSRTPVREVFRRLAGEGYVQIEENRGARVIPMNFATLRNFFLVAPMIYAAVARLAVQNHKPRHLLELKEAQSQFRRAIAENDPLAMVLENNRFHAVMGDMAGNQYIEASLERLLIDHARIGHVFFRPQDQLNERRLALAADHHDAFIDAIERRDENAVIALVHEHWELSRENMELFIAPPGLKADAVFDIPRQL